MSQMKVLFIYLGIAYQKNSNRIYYFDQGRGCNDYENLLKSKPTTDEEEYKIECAALDVSKAFVYDLGYEEACKFARGILALGQIYTMR